MQCGNCGHSLCGNCEAEVKLVLPKQLRDEYCPLPTSVKTIEDKEIVMGSNEVFGDYLYKKVKCPGCKRDVGQRLTTVDEAFVHLQGVCLISKDSVKEAHDNKEEDDAKRAKVLIVADQDVEVGELYNVGLDATCKDAEMLVYTSI